MSVTLALREKYIQFPIQTIPRILSALGYRVHFIFNYIFIKYLFICEKKNFFL